MSTSLFISIIEMNYNQDVDVTKKDTSEKDELDDKKRIDGNVIL